MACLRISGIAPDSPSEHWLVPFQNIQIVLNKLTRDSYRYPLRRFKRMELEPMAKTTYIWDDNAVIAETDDQGTVTASYTRQPDEFGSLISQTKGNRNYSACWLSFVFWWQGWDCSGY